MYAYKTYKTTYEKRCEFWKNNKTYSNEKFRRFVEYEAKHDLLKYFWREIYFYKDLPKYGDTTKACLKKLK